MKHLTVDQARDPLSELAQVQQIVAMESEVLSNFAATINGVVPKLVGAAKDFLGKVRGMAFAPSADTQEQLRNRPAIIQLINKYEYTHLAAMAAYVPEGFNGNLLDYSAFLVRCVNHINGVHEKVLKPYNQFLSALIADAQSVLSSEDRLAFLVKIQKEREALNEEAAKFFRPGATNTRADIGKVVRRNKEWEEIVMNLNVVNRVLAGMKNEDVMKEVDKTTHLLDALKTSAKSGELNTITPVQLRSLSASTLSVAREVEFYAVTRFRAMVFNTAMDDTFSLLKSALGG